MQLIKSQRYKFYNINPGFLKVPQKFLRIAYLLLKHPDWGTKMTVTQKLLEEIQQMTPNFSSLCLLYLLTSNLLHSTCFEISTDSPIKTFPLFRTVVYHEIKISLIIISLDCTLGVFPLNVLSEFPSSHILVVKRSIITFIKIYLLYLLSLIPFNTMDKIEYN